MVAGRLENGSAAAPTNATSHWVWGARAFSHDDASLRHTLVGYVIHHAMSVFWGVVYAAVRLRSAPTQAAVVRDAALVSAAACLVDYTVTPKRLRPGFETRLSRPALAGVYAAFAVGLAAAMLTRRQ